MPVSNPPAAAAGSQPQAPELQQLVALLGSLMPLLLRFQSQTLEQPFHQAGQFQPSPFQANLGNFLVSNPALDHQAAASLVADITADSLRNLSNYLESNVGSHPGLESCVPVVTQAARAFAARDHAQAFNLIWLAYRLIATIRAIDPQIPPLRAAGQAFAADPTASIH
ncbi:MAG: hypothetical protein E6G91_22430 [Alphaproteobacteria bacterium]|jgi:hypothetical protein|nr:MAG: hypothetical protein E6G91_22430 [Alphaproteobacteria bacterium]